MTRAAPFGHLTGTRARASKRPLVAAVAIAIAASAVPAAGQATQEEAGAVPSLLLELNALQASDRGCRFAFLATNNLGAELSAAAFELALFDKAGMLSRLTIIDFKDLPHGKSKVRQFDFSGVDCAGVGRVLVNDATECAGEGVDPKACIRGLKTETRSDVAFGI